MKPLFLLFIGIALAFGSSVSTADPSDSHSLEVVIFAIPQPLWAQFEGKDKEHGALLSHLFASSKSGTIMAPAIVHCLLDGENPGEGKTGKDLPFVIHWDPPMDTELHPKPQKEGVLMIGTQLRAQLKRLDKKESSVQVEIHLTHDYGPPGEKRLNYGAAAKTEEERRKLSVPTPVLDRLEWEGHVALPLGVARLLAAVLEPNLTVRHLIFVTCK